MKHLKSILVLVVLLALLGAAQPVLVGANELPVATDTVPNSAIDTSAGPAVISPDYVLTYPFDAEIPVFTYYFTPDTYTMTAGKYVQGYLENSGGHNVYMTVVDASTHQALGSEIPFTVEGTTQTLWTNTTGTTKYVHVRLGAIVLHTVYATGDLIFGWF
jgi:plastocyanin